MQDRRSFLSKTLLASSGIMLGPLVKSSPAAAEEILAIKAYDDLPFEESITDEDFWHLVKQAYTVSPAILNLNNGGVSPQPRVVQEAVERYNKLSNEAPSYYMWRTLDMGREPIRAKLAALAGVQPDTIAINRNSSEALETVIFGLRLKAGDEVVLSRQDYPNMINAWKQREHRDGIVLKWVSLEYPIESDEEIVSVYRKAMTSRTKLVHVTHMINWNGQILPARKLADMAHSAGAEILLDAAHTFGHIQYNIGDLDCDYFGSSLHKWLCAPFGSGMLYVRPEKIRNLYPLFGHTDPESTDIRKFEALGTRSFAIEQAIGQAIDFHLMIGIERKQARLQYLKNYWAKAALQMPGVSIGTSLNGNYGCALALLQVDGRDPSDVGNFLFQKKRIHTTTVKWENISGVRVTPHVYTLTSDLDRLVDGIAAFLKH